MSNRIHGVTSESVSCEGSSHDSSEHIHYWLVIRNNPKNSHRPSRILLDTPALGTHNYVQLRDKKSQLRIHIFLFVVKVSIHNNPVFHLNCHQYPECTAWPPLCLFCSCALVLFFTCLHLYCSVTVFNRHQVSLCD